MMGKNILFLFFLAFACFGCSNLKYLDAYNGLKGRPKTVEVTKFKTECADSLTKSDVGYKFTYVFDDKGRIKESIEFKLDDTPCCFETYVYDKKGNISQLTSYRADSSIINLIIYEYDKYGRIVTKTSVSSPNEKYVEKRTYNKTDNIVQISNTVDGKFFHNTILQLDEKGNEIELKSFDNAGNLLTRIENSYDERGNQTKSKWYNSENLLHTFNESTYNEHNDRISLKSYVIFKGKATLKADYRFEYLYDINDNCIEEKAIYGFECWLKRIKIIY